MHKIAFTLGPLSIHWYGVMVAAGFLAGLWTASRRGVRDQLPPDKMLDLGPWLILGILLGARALYVISYWREDFASKPWTEMFMIHRGGLVFYGGFVGATLAMWFYLRLKKLPVWKVADALAPSIALGSVFGRLGCLMNGCCYGEECSWPWAVRFPPPHPKAEVGLHPTQVYDAFLNLVLYLGLAWLYRRKRFDGQVFAAFAIGYALLRALVEIFRGDYGAHQLGVLTPAQVFSILILLGGALLYWKLSRPARSPS